MKELLSEQAAQRPGKSLPRLERYTLEQARIWNEFVARSKNATFLFDRNYMDYHADRFTDHSLLIWDGNKLLGLLPATQREAKLVSHGGLTFGGILTDQRMRTTTMVEIFGQLRQYLHSQGLEGLIYKAIPHIYHRMPAEEDLYALFVHNAQLIRRDVSSTIRLGDRADITKGRKCGIKTAQKEGIEVNPSNDFRSFMAIEEENLRKKYNVRPTHSTEELQLLASRFPKNIRLFLATRRGELLGGAVIYQSERVAHAQYLATTEEGRDLGCLDAIIEALLTKYVPEVPYFDFGISTEQQGRYLNEGLIDNKESFGARATVYDFYELAPG
jgi:hypothetical protein